jgi:hypothetical protein
VPFPFAFARLNALQAAVRHYNSLNLIIFIYVMALGSSIGWVAVAVANAGGADSQFFCSGGSICHGG